MIETDLFVGVGGCRGKMVNRFPVFSQFLSSNVNFFLTKIQGLLKHLLKTVVIILQVVSKVISSC